MAMLVVDPLEVIHIEHQDRQAVPVFGIVLGHDPDLLEEVRSVVESCQRVADRSFEEITLESLFGRVEPDEFQDDPGTQSNPVSITYAPPPLRRNAAPIEVRPV